MEFFSQKFDFSNSVYIEQKGMEMGRWRLVLNLTGTNRNLPESCDKVVGNTETFETPISNI